MDSKQEVLHWLKFLRSQWRWFKTLSSYRLLIWWAPFLESSPRCWLKMVVILRYLRSWSNCWPPLSRVCTKTCKNYRKKRIILFLNMMTDVFTLWNTITIWSELRRSWEITSPIWTSAKTNRVPSSIVLRERRLETWRSLIVLLECVKILNPNTKKLQASEDKN